MRALIHYQIRSEFRKNSIFFSLVFYLVSLVFINYLALGIPGKSLSAGIWSALFWMVLLSALVNTIAKSFLGNKPGLNIYFYSLASPAQIIASKIIYGFVLCFGISCAGFIFFSIWLGNPVKDLTVFLAVLLLASFGFSAALSVLSAIASKTSNGSMVMAILSFPVIIGILLMSIKATRNAIDGLGFAASTDELSILAAIDAIAASTSYLLFPYIWRS